jgi:hypothetical protein
MAIKFLDEQIEASPKIRFLDEASKEQEQQAQEVSTVDYLLNRAKAGLTNLASAFTAGSAQQQGTFAGAFPTQPELEATPTQVQRGVFGVKDMKAPAVNVPGYGLTTMPMQVLGGGVEALTDPLSYVAPGSLLSRAGMALSTGAGAETGAEAGAQVEKAITGTEGTTGRVVGALLGGVGATTATAPARTATKAAANLTDQIWDKYKAVKIDPVGTENALSASAAKRLLEHAVKAEGAQNLDQIIADVNDAAKYVTGKEAPLLVAMAGNPVMKEQIVRLAKSNPEARARLQQELDNIAKTIDQKASTIFGERYAGITAGETGIKTKNVGQRIVAIDNQLEKLADPLVQAEGKTDIGKAVKNLVTAKKAAVRADMAPQYDSLLSEAREARVTLPAQATQQLYNFVEANKLQDIFGVDTTVGKKIMSILKPTTKLAEGVDPNVAALERAAGLEAKTTDVFNKMSFDDVDSLKKEINRLQRTVKNDVQQFKLKQLEEQLDGVRDQYIPEWSDKLRQIDSAYYEKLGVLFGAQGIKDIDSAKYASRVAPIIVDNKQGLQDFLKVAGDEGIPIAQNALISQAYGSVVKDGLIDAKALFRFLKSKAEVLNEPQMAETKKILEGALVDDRVLRLQRAKLDLAAKDAAKRTADNYLLQTDIPDYKTMLSSFLGSSRDRAKLVKNISDLSPETADAVRQSLRAELADRALNASGGSLAFLTDKANKAGIEAIMGKGYQESLMKIGKLSDALRQADISRLSLEMEKSKLDAIGKVVPGLDIPYVTSTLRDRISSNVQKAVRLLSRVNTARMEESFDQQLLELLVDPNGVKKLADVSSDISFKIKNPVELNKAVSSILDSLPAKTYISMETAEEQ